MLNLALVRLIEIIGEASTRVSIDCKARTPHIPWQVIKGTRNRIVHGYDNVDFDILWDTIQIDLPPLIKALEAIVNE